MERFGGIMTAALAQRATTLDIRDHINIGILTVLTLGAGLRWSPNAVTYLRTIVTCLSVPLCMAGLETVAFVFYSAGWWGDSLDGSVARNHKVRGTYTWDERLGEFVDPMADKAAFAITTFYAGLEYGYNAPHTRDGLLVLMATLLILCLELMLATARVRAYESNKGLHVDDQRSLAAVRSGKIKMALEGFGTGTILFGYIAGPGWYHLTGALMLFTAIPFACMSLYNKRAVR